MKKRQVLGALLLLLVGCASAPLASGSNQLPVLVPSIAPNQAHVTTLPATFQTLADFGVDDHDDIIALCTDAVRKLTPDGHLTVLANTVNGANSGFDAPGLVNPQTIAVGFDGTAYFTGLTNQVYKLALDGTVTSVRIPTSEFGLYPGIAVDRADNAYVSVSIPDGFSPSGNENYIAKITPAGTVSVFAGQPGAAGGFVDALGTAARLSSPGALAFDGVGNMYVADRGNGAIRRITPDGNVSTVVGRGAPASLPPSPMPGEPSPDLSALYQGDVSAAGLAVDRAGNLFFTSSDNHVYRITPGGELSAFAGDGRVCRHGVACTDVCPTLDPNACLKDGPGLAAEFLNPTRIVANQEGVLYVLDGDESYSARKIREVR